MHLLAVLPDAAPSRAVLISSGSASVNGFHHHTCTLRHPHQHPSAHLGKPQASLSDLLLTSKQLLNVKLLQGQPLPHKGIRPARGMSALRAIGSRSPRACMPARARAALPRSK